MPDPRVEELDQQIDLLETLRDFDAELKDFSSWLDTLIKAPKTGDLAADFEIGQMRDLLLKLSDQLGHYTDPLNQATDLAGRISGLVTALDAISTAASNPDAPPEEIITALGDFIGGLNSALPLLGRVFSGLNPVVGVYILLLGEMLKGIARSVQVIARQVEVRNDAIDMFDDVIEGRYDLPDQDQVEEDQAQDALEAELTDLYLRRARLERRLRELDYRNALRICLRRRNQNENIYEGDVAELEAHQDEWAQLTTISSFRDLTEAEQERLDRLNDMIHRRRAQIQEIQRCVRELLEQVRIWRGGAAVMGGGCLWALVPFLLVSVLGVGALVVLGGDDGSDTAVGSPAPPSSSTTSAPSSTSSSTTSSTEPPLVLDDLVAEHGSIAQILFDAGATLGQIDRILDRFAPDDDAGVPQFIYSMEGHDVTGNGEPGIDIADWYLGELDTTLLPGLVDGALPCGLTGTRTVVCPDGQSEVPEGPVIVAAMRLAGPVPLIGSDRQYIYSAVFETDGDPANDWMPQDPYGWDYFQGTDRWFEGFGMLSSQQWELDVVAVSSTQQQSIAPSDAVLVIDGDAAAFFIPAGEVGGTEGLCGRLTAFVTDGSYSPEASAGDISGGAPTAPLWNLEGRAMLSTAAKVRNALLGSLAGLVVVVAFALLTGDEADEADEAAGSAETTTTESIEPEETTTTETVESPEEFAERLATAIRDGDATFLFDRLAEETLERYGADQCETYTTGLHDEQFALELREVAAKQDWVYETDGVSTTVDDVTALELERTDSRGETIIQEIHLARRGTVFHWFTDCGDPEG